MAFKKKGVFFAVFLFFFSAMPLLSDIHAQTGMMSPYSVFGPGYLQPYLNVRNMSMGGIAVGLSGKGEMNPFNPATYRTGVDTLSVRFDLGFNLSMNNLTQRRSDGETVRNQSTSGGLSNLEFYFPVCKWYKMAVYLIPVTDMFYKTSYFADAGEFIGQTQLTHEGTGGIAKLGWGHSLGWGPVSVGANLNYQFGRLMQTSTLSFTDDSLASYAGEAQFYTETKLDGFSADFGINFSPRIKESQYLSIGASYSLKSTLYGKRTTMAQGVFSSVEDTAYMPDAATKGTVILPSSVRVGISYEYVDQFVVGADFTYTWWKEYEEYGRKYDFFRNTYAANLGAELKNNPQATSIARRFAYRIGGFFQSHYTAYSGKELFSYGFSLGVGIPVRKTRSLINVGLQFGQTGALSRGQIRENFMRIGVSFSSVETWFVKPKYD